MVVSLEVLQLSAHSRIVDAEVLGNVGESIPIRAIGASDFLRSATLDYLVVSQIEVDG